MTIASPVCRAEGASSAPIELAGVPAKAELSATSDTQITVLLTNTGSEAVSLLQLSSRPVHPAEEESEIQPAKAAGLAAGGTRAYQVTIPPWKQALPPPPLSLLAKFEVGQPGVVRIASSTVELLPPTTLELEKLASLEAKASLTTLKSGQTEPVYLLVRNKSTQPLTVRSVEASGPPFIEFEKLPRNRVVEAGRTAVLRLDAKADDRVRPGEQQLVFRLPVSIGGSDFDLVATQSAKVGVAGESEILTALGIPSLLLLPGFLALAMASILWTARFLRDESDDGSFPFPLKEPESWMLTVIGSAAILFVAWLCGVNLLDQYSLTDVILLWIASMIAGGLLYVAAQLISNQLRRSRVPAVSDEPIVVLEKLARQGLDLERPRFSYDTGSETLDLYMLQPASDSRPSTWSAPKIVYTWMELDEALNERIQEQLDHNHDAAALAASLRDGVSKKSLAVAYAGDAGGAVHSPVLVPKEKIGSNGSPMVMAGER